MRFAAARTGYLCLALILAACAHRPPCPCGTDSPLLSRSKLSLCLPADYTVGAHEVVSARPRALQVCDPQANRGLLDAMFDYKRVNPQGVLVVGICENAPGIRYTVADDPKASADDWYARVLAPALSQMGPEARALIDFLGGPSEGEGMPGWESVESAKWRGRFDARLARRIAQVGLRPCIGGMALGEPSGTDAEFALKLDAYSPALRAAKRCNGAWGYHAYTRAYSTDPAAEKPASLRYRGIYDYFREAHPELADLPLILNEIGVGESDNAIEQYEAWLRWFDREIRRDPYVVAATLIETGGAANGSSSETEPIATWLARHLSMAR